MMLWLGDARESVHDWKQQCYVLRMPSSERSRLAGRLHSS